MDVAFCDQVQTAKMYIAIDNRVFALCFNSYELKFEAINDLSPVEAKSKLNSRCNYHMILKRLDKKFDWGEDSTISSVALFAK